MESPHEDEQEGQERQKEILSLLYDEWLKREARREQLQPQFFAVQNDFYGMMDLDNRRQLVSPEDREKFKAMEDRLKKLSVAVGISKMLTLGDWRVDRENEITEGFGVIPFPKIETRLLQFTHEHGSFEQGKPHGDAWLVHLHAGAGNGVLVAKLRDNSTDPFSNGHQLRDYFLEIGYGDYFYYTPENILQKNLKDEYRDDPEMLDFLRMVMILVKKKSHFAHEVRETMRAYLEGRYYDFLSQLAHLNLLRINGIYFPVRPDGIESFFTLAFLPENPDLLRVIFANLTEFVSELENTTKILNDGEFLADTEIVIPESVKKLLAEYKELGGEAFCKKYFKSNFCTANYNLSGDIDIYPQNVIPGKFETIDDTLPKSWDFTLIHSFRSSSHLEDASYAQFIKTLCARLVPGGIFIDDGMRQSYTRFERIKELQDIQRVLGEEFRFEIITDGERPKSILIQRGIKKDDSSFVFFRDSHYGNKLLLDQHFIIPLDEYERRWPNIVQQNGTIRSLRELLKLLVEKMGVNLDLQVQGTVSGTAGRIWIREKDPPQEMQGRYTDIGSVVFSFPLDMLRFPIGWDLRVAESKMQQIMRKIFTDRMTRMQEGQESRLDVAAKYDVHERFDSFFQAIFPDV